jgi:hypothetical protein
VQQKSILLDPKFSAFNVDQVLMKLEDLDKYPGFVDPRFCLVFWARPTVALKKLGLAVQKKLKDAFPGKALQSSVVNWCADGHQNYG